MFATAISGLSTLQSIGILVYRVRWMEARMKGQTVVRESPAKMGAGPWGARSPCVDQLRGGYLARKREQNKYIIFR